MSLFAASNCAAEQPCRILIHRPKVGTMYTRWACFLGVLCAHYVFAHAAFAGSSNSDSLVVVDMGLHTHPSIQVQLAVQTCVGLTNRGSGHAAYVLRNSQDLEQLSTVAGVTPVPTSTPIDTVLASCLAGNSAVAKGALLYNYSMQQAIVPNLITLAGVLDIVPMEAADVAKYGVPVAFDAVAHFGTAPAVNVTAFVYDNYANATTSMAFMDPGYNQHDGGIFDPSLTGTPDASLVDFIVKERLFNFYMVEACIPFTADHALMERMVALDGSDPWPRPIPTYGYNDADNVLGGDFFEAETNCVAQHDMGQIASDSAGNMAFFSREPTITAPLRQVPTPAAAPYNSSKSYVTLVVGDGDNVGMVQGARYDWMKQRAARCRRASAQEPCFPLVWTLSPQTLHMAPAFTRWFYAQAASTQADYFMLPPSGDLYAYPAMMPPAVQESFVASTEQVARTMNTSATVDWEWFLTWSEAFKSLFPRYAEQGVVRGVFAVCVPFMFPVLPFLGDHDHYAILNATATSSRVVVFKPREWRGSGNTTIPFAGRDYFTPAQMAAELNSNPRGTVSYIYLTSDGGANLTQYDELVPLLAPHLEVVDAQTLVEMALQRG